MIWTVQVSKSAFKFLQNCPADVRRRAIDRIEELEKGPFPGDVSGFEAGLMSGD